MSEANFAVATEADLASYFTASRTGLVNFAQSLTRDRGRSEDIVAEAYIQVVGMIRRGKGPTAEKLEPYVKVCVRNEAFRQAKRNSNEVPTPFIEALVDEMIETVSEPDHNGTWDEEAATRAFHTLSPRSQSILRLTTIQGQRVSAVSEQLGMSERAVVSAAFRARQNLRTRYLVEVTADSHNCRDIRIDYLASFARDQASTRREKKISAHIQHCSSCEQTLRRMRALRLPATVIVGIAATASVMSPHAGSSAQAAELAQKDQALQAIDSGSGSATPKIILGASILALLTAAAFLFVFVQPRDSTPSTSDNTASQLDSTNSDESAGSSTQQRDGTETHPTDTSRPGSPNSTSTSDSDQEALPDGVHSVEWGDAPANYTAGQTGARLLLSVRFDNSGTPADYDVVVTLPEGVALVRASAGCTENGSEVRCDPPDNLRPTDLFSLQFYVDLDSSFSGGLPTADLVNSGS